MKLLKSLKTQRNVFIIIILLIDVAICYSSLQSNRWFSGWDNLHPEFNWQLNLQRYLNWAWESHQGVGFSAVQAYGADLPRMFILYITSFFIKQNLIRYVYVCFCLIVGSLGMFFLTNEFTKEKLENNYVAGFIAAITYIFNLGTLQQFYVVFEMFVHFYMILPWIILSLIILLKKINLKNLLIFSLLSFFSSSIAYAPNLWLVYIGLIFIILLIYFLKERKLKYLRNILIILFSIFITNAFWIVPVTWSYLSNSSTNVIASHMNRISSPEIFQRNAAFGDISDVLVSKNFLFSFQELDNNGKVINVLQPWIDYLSNPGIKLILYFQVSLVLIGIGFSIYKRLRFSITFFIGYILCFFFLVNQNPPFTNIFTFLQNNSKLFIELFRNPFTKFSIPFVLFGSIFSGVGFLLLIQIVNKVINNRKYTTLLLVYGFLVVILIGYLPYFKGSFVDNHFYVDIPQDYFDLFKWSDNQNKNERIAFMPTNSIWSWIYYDWGYRGSGFQWFGINQPTMDRAFDPYNPANEEFYNEYTHAYFSNDLTLFNNVLDKYKVRWVIFDKSKIISDVSDPIKERQNISQFLESDTFLTKTETFGNVEIWNYTKLKPSTPITKVQIGNSFNQVDNIFDKEGNYVKTSNKPYKIYPIVSLDPTTGTKVSIDNSKINFETNFSLEDINKYVIKDSDKLVYAYNISAKKVGDNITLDATPVYPIINLNGQNININSDGEYTINFISHSNKFDLKAENTTIKIDNLTSELQYFGFVRFDSVNLDKIIKIYSREDSLVFNSNVNKVTDLNFSVCGTSSGNVINSHAFLNSEYSLKNINSNSCINLFNSTLSSGDYLIKSIFRYKSENDTRPFYCIYNSKKQECFNYKYNSDPGYSNDWKDFQDNYEISLPENQDVAYSLQNIAYGINVDKGIQFKDVSINIELQIISWKLNDKEITSLDLPLVNGNNKFIISYQKDLIQNNINLSSRVNLDKRVCGDKSIQSTKKIDQDSIKYSLSNTILCDEFNLSDISMNHDDFIQINFKDNLSLQPTFNFYKFISNQQLVSEDIATTSDNYFHEFIHLNTQSQESNGYKMGIKISNFTKLDQELTINNLIIYHIPISQLINLNFVDLKNSQATLQIDNINLQKLNPSYNPGWISINNPNWNYEKDKYLINGIFIYTGDNTHIIFLFDLMSKILLIISLIFIFFILPLLLFFKVVKERFKTYK